MTPTPTTTSSRYEVVIAKFGTRTTVRSDVFLNYSLYGEPDGPIEMDYFFWVLRNDFRTIVVDTGFSPDGGASRGRSQVADVPSILRSLEVGTTAAPTVLLTHAHYDHVGNVGLFPRSPVVMAEKELDFWEGRNAQRPLFRHSVDAGDIDALGKVRAEGRLQLFSGSHTPAPGVEMIEVGGHTPGQSLIKVQSPDGPVLLASDAVHYYEELDRDMPFSSVADVVDMYDGFELIRRMLDDGEVLHLVSGHDPSTLSRFEPLSGDLAGIASAIGRHHG